jgi:hypothetical protein
VPCCARLPPAPAPLHASPPNSPTALAPLCWPSPSAPRRPTEPPLCRRRPPPLTATAALPVPPPVLAALTCRLQAGRRPSSSPLAFSRAGHIAPPLPELCSADAPPVDSSCSGLPCLFLVPQHDQELSSTTYIRSHGHNSLSRLLLHWTTAALVVCHRPLCRCQLAPPLLKPHHYLQ